MDDLRPALHKGAYENAVELVTYEAFLGRMDLGNREMKDMMENLAFERLQRIQSQYPFSTTLGYMGLTCHGKTLEPKIGDLMCLLSGGPVPFILRKEADKYLYMCACYL
jgi:hypothetical protein